VVARVAAAVDGSAQTVLAVKNYGGTVRRWRRADGGAAAQRRAGGGVGAKAWQLRWRLAARVEEQRRQWWIEKRDIEEGIDQDERLKGRRSAFHAVIGRTGRLTGRGGAASGQSPVSSWHDRTRPVRYDRMLTESIQRSPREPNTHDRTRWWGQGPNAVVTTSRPVQRLVTDP
jgi:hypothetical protein